MVELLEELLEELVVELVEEVAATVAGRSWLGAMLAGRLAPEGIGLGGALCPPIENE